MAKMTLSHTKRLIEYPVYDNGYLIGYVLRFYGKIPLRWFNQESLDYLKEKYPCEIHADGVK